ncbi:pseudouridine synthase [Naematelia encephala]|uniref:tRNA pseudouridine(55) synthase n=1 Tax=Naematelia encephala TaxID=71784 RepID=A0A1Y2AY83_9TREE|nr:pseudouridine synthase [Naematelia encephala]
MSKSIRPALKSLSAFLDRPASTNTSQQLSSTSKHPTAVTSNPTIPSSLTSKTSATSLVRMSGDTPMPPLPLNGLFPIAKPSGILSMRLIDQMAELFEDSRLFYDKVKIEEKQAHKRKRNKTGFKVGQGGTLDPLADGVLGERAEHFLRPRLALRTAVIGVNRGTKYLQAYLDGTKEYVSTGLLGAATDTMDADGKVLSTAPWEHVTREMIEQVLDQFRGTIKQTPPIFSALKMEGKQLYEYARENKPLPRPIPVRDCTVSIDLIDFQPASKPDIPNSGHEYRWPSTRLSPEEKQVFTSLTQIVKDAKTEDPTVQVAAMPDVAAEDVPEVSSTGLRPPIFTVRMSVSKGTYVRSLINDIGLAIGSAAHVVVLTRTRQGQFFLQEDRVDGDGKKHGISPPTSPGPNKKAHTENGGEAATSSHIKNEAASSSSTFTPSSVAMRWEIWDRAFKERAKMLKDEQEEREEMTACGKLEAEIRDYFSHRRIKERRMARPLREWETEMLKHFHPVEVPVPGGHGHERPWQERRDNAAGDGMTEEERMNV